MAVERISKRSVDALAVDPARDVYLWDAEIKGFGLKLTRAGALTYLVQYQAPSDGRTRRYTIGRHGPLTPDMARAEAKRIIGGVALGRDPSEEKAASRGAGLTVADLCDLYLSEGCATKKASTVNADRSRIDCHIRPFLGSMPVASVSRADVERLLQGIATGKTKKARTKLDKPRATSEVRGGKGSATRTVGMLGAIFTFAVRRGLRPDSPCTGVKRYADRKLERFLSDTELSALGESLADIEARGAYHPSGLGVIRLLVLTGCRCDEVRTLHWRWVDFDRRCLRLPDSKTGQKTVKLGAAAVDYLRDLAAVRDPSERCVFPGTEPGEPFSYTGVTRVWKAVRKRADLEDVRLHDLRHAFASVGASAGESLAILGKLLGHRHATTTQRYAHLSDNPLEAAADRVSGHVATALGVGAKRATPPALASSSTTTAEPAGPSSAPVVARAGAPVRTPRPSSVPRARRGGE